MHWRPGSSTLPLSTLGRKPLFFQQDRDSGFGSDWTDLGHVSNPEPITMARAMDCADRPGLGLAFRNPQGRGVGALLRGAVLGAERWEEAPTGKSGEKEPSARQMKTNAAARAVGRKGPNLERFPQPRQPYLSLRVASSRLEDRNGLFLPVPMGMAVTSQRLRNVCFPQRLGSGPPDVCFLSTTVQLAAAGGLDPLAASRFPVLGVRARLSRVPRGPGLGSLSKLHSGMCEPPPRSHTYRQHPVPAGLWD